MPNNNHPRHQQQLPAARNIKRACSRELYRTIKRLNKWIPPELVAQAEELYIRKVFANLLWITEQRSNRKALCDWWDEHVCGEIAELWQVDREALSKAFRRAFGG